MRFSLGSLSVVGLATGVLTLLAGCTTPGSERIVGPDGSAMAHVHCGDEQGVCFRIAGELCPSGYEIQPVLSGSDGNFLVRCRAAGARAAVAPCAGPVAPSPARVAAAPPTSVAAPGASHTDGGSVAAQERWPPATEPWSSTSPWPAAAASVAAHAPEKTATTPTGDVDIGY